MTSAKLHNAPHEKQNTQAPVHRIPPIRHPVPAFPGDRTTTILPQIGLRVRAVSVATFAASTGSHVPYFVHHPVASAPSRGVPRLCVTPVRLGGNDDTRRVTGRVRAVRFQIGSLVHTQPVTSSGVAQKRHRRMDPQPTSSMKPTGACATQPSPPLDHLTFASLHHNHHRPPPKPSPEGKATHI